MQVKSIFLLESVYKINRERSVGKKAGHLALLVWHYIDALVYCSYGRGPMIFYAQNAIFSHFCSLLASLAINFDNIFNRKYD